MIVANLMIGLPAMLLCLVLQATFTVAGVRYYARHMMQLRSGGQGLLAEIRPLLMVMLIIMLGNFLQILLWASIFVWLGEFAAFYEAFYHSAVNFAALGYGDIVMSRPWKLLGPMEALNGVLMLGMTAAALMTMLQDLLKRRDMVK